MAGTDAMQNSTILPSILPAMNSIQSNDIITSLGQGKSTQQQLMERSQMERTPDPLINSAIKAVQQPAHAKGLSFHVSNLNQRSMHAMQQQ